MDRSDKLLHFLLLITMRRLIIIGFLLFSNICLSQSALVATRFDYPIGDRGNRSTGNPFELLENFNANAFGVESENSLYPDNLSNTHERNGDCQSINSWYNAQDVGSYYNEKGGYHPGEDWNYCLLDDKGKRNPVADVGKEVYAVANGEVIETGIISSTGIENKLGRFVIVKHILENGKVVYSIYLHLSDLTVDNNIKKNVTIGQVIGKVGPVSDVSPHLHFEMWDGSSGVIPSRSTLWASSIGSNGYYSESKTMKNLGIIDPSDFIDKHRGYPANNNLEIYGGPRNSPYGKVKIWCDLPNGGIGFIVSNLRVNNYKLPSANIITNTRYNSTLKRAIFEIDLRDLKKVNYDKLVDNGPYDLNFDITYQGISTNYYSSKRIYFLDPLDITDLTSNDWLGNYYIPKGVKNGLFKGYPTGIFGANAVLTKGQAAKILVSALSKLSDVFNITSGGAFPNSVDPNSQFFPYIQTAANNSWIPNYDLNYHDGDPITIREFSYMIYKAFELGLNTSQDKPKSYVSNIAIKNAGTYSTFIHGVLETFYQNSELKLIENIASLLKFQSGNTSQIIDGTAFVTRGTMAKIITNLFVWKSGKLNLGTSRMTQTNDFSTHFVIGDKYESTDQPVGNIPSLSSQIKTAYTINDNESLTLSHSSDYDEANNGVPLYFYWTADGGDTLKKVTDNFRSVVFTPGKIIAPTTFHLYTQAGNTLGKVREYYIDVLVNPTNLALTTNTPTQQASNLQIASSGENNLNLSCTRGNGSYCIVTCTPSASNIVPPSPNLIYTGNTNFSIAGVVGNETRVVYTGIGSSVNIANLQPNTGYKIAVYEYSGTTSETVKYMTTPLCFTSAFTKAATATTSNFSWAGSPLVNGVAFQFFSMTQNSNVYSWSVSPTATIATPTSVNTAITFPSAGNYNVTLMASNSVTGQNDSKTVAVTVLNAATNLPDLQVQGITVNSNTVTAGSSISVTCNASQNNTTVPTVSQSFYLQYYLSTDQIIDGSDFAVGQELVTLGNSFSKTITHSLTVQLSYTGNYYILIRIDNSNSVPETDENNNLSNAGIFVVAALPDFTITNLTLTGGNILKSGQIVAANLTVLNKGQIAYQNESLYSYNSLYSISYYISKDNQLDISDYGMIVNGSISSQPAINPSQSLAFANSSAVIPPDWANGNYYLIVVFDPKAVRDRDHNVEMDENNNSFVIPITISNSNQPTAQVSAIKLSNITSTGLTIGWTNGNGNKRIVIARNAGIPFPPVDGISYTGNSNWLSAPLMQYPNITPSRILYTGTANSVNISGLNPDSTYFFAVYEFNDLGGSNIDYLQQTNTAAIQTHTPPVTPGVNGWKVLLKNIQPSIGGVFFLTKETGFFNSEAGIASTSDGGTTWKFNKYKGTDFYSGKYFDGVSYGAGSTNGIYFAGQNNNVGFITENSIIFKTIDKGISWAPCYNNKTGNSYNRFFVMSPAICFYTVNVNGNSKLYKSVDTAKTFSELYSISSQNEYLWDIFFADQNTGWITSGNGTVFKTINGGTTWNVSKISTGCSSAGYSRIFFTDALNGFYADYCGNLYRTTDGGTAWTLSKFMENQVFPEIDFIDQLNGRIHYGYNYIKTTDGGNNWILDSVPNLGISYKTGIFSRVSENDSWVYGTNGSSKILAKTQTGGATSQITITSVLPPGLCPGSTLSIDFSLIGTFGLNNKINVQLSDTAGVFSQPVVLAEKITNISGSIVVTFPQNLPSSNKYRIRLSATTPSVNSNTSEYLSFSPAPFVTINSLQESYPNNAGSFALTGTPGGGVFKIDGLTAISFVPTSLTTGNHVVTYTYTSGGCSSVIERNVKVYIPLSVSVSSLPLNSYCAGSILSLSYTVTGDFDSTNYFIAQLSDATGSFAIPVDLGSVNSNKSGNFTCPLPVTSVSGNNYKVRMVSSFGSIVSNQTASFAIANAITPAISITTNNDLICSGKNAVFTSSGTGLGNSPQYTWLLNGLIVGLNTPTYSNNSLNDGDVVQVRVNSNAGCVSQATVYSEIKLINVVMKPDTPSIAKFDSILVSSSTIGNQWYLNGQKINGATEQFYITNSGGVYQVKVSVSPCDTLVSSIFNNVVTAVNNINLSLMQIFVNPNPASQIIVVTGLSSSKQYQYLLSDYTGKALLTGMVKNSSRENINIQNVPAGVYLLQLYSIQQKRLLGTEKIIIVH